MILTADGNEEVFSKNRSLIGRVEIMVHKQCGTGTPRAFLKRGKSEVEKLRRQGDSGSKLCSQGKFTSKLPTLYVRSLKRESFNIVDCF